jgi:hypothetical protein
MIDEIHPLAVVFGLLGGLIALIVAKPTEVGFVWKSLTFFIGVAVTFLLSNHMFNN